MKNKCFLNLLQNSEEFLSLTNAVEKNLTPVLLSGVPESVASHLAFSTCKKLDRSLLLIAPDGVSARRLYDDISFFDGSAMLYLDKELIFYNVDTVANEVSSSRIEVLNNMLKNDNFIVVTTISALLSVTVKKESFLQNCLRFAEGEEIDENLSEKFFVLGYKREETVEGKGQYCIRGGIIDFFPFDSDLPYRIELFDTEIDTVRTFDPMTQRTVDRVNEVTAIPACEYVLDKKEREMLLNLMKEKASDSLFKANIEKDTGKLQNCGIFPSVDKYIPLIYKDKLPTILDYTRSDTLFFMYEPQRVFQSAKACDDRVNETVLSLVEKGMICPSDGRWILDYKDALLFMEKHPFMLVCDILSSITDVNPKIRLKLTAKEQVSFHGKMDFFYDVVSRYKKQNYGVIVLAGTDVKAINITEALNDLNISATYVTNPQNPPKQREVIVTCGELEKGFEYPLVNIAVISDREIFGASKRRRKRRASNNQERIKSFTDLHVGDYVVHQSHGIGIFDGINTMTVDGATSDYLKIRFSGDDFLYVPANQLDVLYKYVGKEGVKLHLNKLGGTKWAQTKLRVKNNCADMAKQLIELYAERQNVRGIEFSKNTDMHQSFDSTFLYDETDDQLDAINDVYRDMERSVPMDRLLCGDVGYGKTEVAMRAAFKATYDGYQVAYLVPTTILANQHFTSFYERMSEFGINVALMSRFRTKKQQEETVKKINRGEVDIVIGTHRILQKDIKFKKLGLIVIDEEQRFGVSDKEKLKELRKNADVLTLSATPIPRTLHMSMVGIRDMSVLENPPKDRYPVSTFVMEYNSEIVKEAVLREVSRNGQVYYLHNRTEDIENVARKISSFSPHIRVSYAHGKMSERELEKIMQSVIDREIDVLVCTTIIETGLDIPNVNTIIVDDADRMGLSQLYQLRGRVGRSSRLSYAYLLYKPDKVLTEIANKRLRAIRDFTEFGSGFKIALRDLEIRGAGNVIGSQQHGFMDSVGYDMYCKLLEEAVSEIRGDLHEDETKTTVSLNINAYIPKDYIKAENYRIEMYKKISMICSETDANDVYEEIEDRYGTVPDCLNNLIEISLLRENASLCGISEIKQKGKNAILVFDSDKKLSLEVLSKLIEKHKDMIMFSPTGSPYITVRCDGKDILKNIKIVLQTFKSLKDCEK